MVLSAELTVAIWWSTVLLLKLATFPVIVGVNRMRRKVYVAEEDVAYGGGQVKLTDVVIERIRRAHLNDMENIIPFIGLLFIYAVSGCTAGPGCVTLVAQIFTAARVLHTVVYLGEIRQPFRAIGFFVGVICNVYMGAKILLHLY